MLRGSEIVEELIYHTEIAHYLHYPRFRPIYYALRLLESWAWGARPSLWYAFRILIFALFVSFFWYLISDKVGLVIGGFISFYVATQMYWVDIISRMGPSEIYAVFGLVLFGLGVSIIYKSNKVIGWWYIFIGAIICSGAKENFLFLVLPILYIGWVSYKKGKLGLVRFSLLLGVLVWMLWIGFTIIVATWSYGGDVYNNPVGITGRFSVLIKLFERVDVLGWLSICILLLLSKRLFEVRIPNFMEDFNQTMVMSALLTLIYTSQIFFYNGVWPVDARYDFPGLLIGPLMLVVLVSFLQKVTLINGFTQFRSALILLSTICVIILVFSQFNNIRDIRSKNNQNVDKTVAFTKKMEQWANLGVQHPDYVLIIQTDNPVSDYEPVFSYFRFLRFYNVRNKITFLWAGRKPEAYSNQFKAALAEDLSKLSLYGREPLLVSGNDQDFTPFPEIDKSDTKCILLLMSGQPKKHCAITVAGGWQ